MEARQLGDYLLKEILAEHPGLITWAAEQASVQREVVVIELTDLDKREAFLADVRAKAGVDHPLIGSVFEAVSEENQCYVALEKITSQSLADRLEVGEPLRPGDLAHLLRRTAEAMLQLSAGNTGTEPLTPSAIHFDDHGVVRIHNIARHGEPDPNGPAADIAHLGASLPALVADGHPGASRVLTVLAWMRGEGIEKPLHWDQVRSYGEQIEGQLLETTVTASSPQTKQGPRKRRPVLPILFGSVGVLVIFLGLLYALKPDTPETPLPPIPILPQSIAISGGAYPSPDGGTEKVAAYRISACEVTIGQYNEFLEVLEQLDPSERGVFDLEGQPAEKTNHIPDDWPALIKAAHSKGSWQGQAVDTYHPIINIDWWDAAAYCNWKGCRLPTQEEWFAALRSKVTRPEVLKPAPWSSVLDIGVEDRTPERASGDGRLRFRMDPASRHQPGQPGRSQELCHHRWLPPQPRQGGPPARMDEGPPATPARSRFPRRLPGELREDSRFKIQVSSFLTAPKPWLLKLES